MLQNSKFIGVNNIPDERTYSHLHLLISSTKLKIFLTKHIYPNLYIFYKTYAPKNIQWFDLNYMPFLALKMTNLTHIVLSKTCIQRVLLHY